MSESRNCLKINFHSRNISQSKIPKATFYTHIARTVSFEWPVNNFVTFDKAFSRQLENLTVGSRFRWPSHCQSYKRCNCLCRSSQKRPCRHGHCRLKMVRASFSSPGESQYSNSISLLKMKGYVSKQGRVLEYTFSKKGGGYRERNKNKEKHMTMFLRKIPIKKCTQPFILMKRLT